MKRLFRISFDLFLLSVGPVLSWFLLGIIVDKNLINIFTLTYPLQFIYYMVKAVFSTGANINKEKDGNNDAVMSGLVVGTIVSFLIFSFVLLNVDNYITFMHQNIEIYKTFTIYSIIQIFLCLEFAMILNKLYYEEKNELANKYSIIYNLINFIVLVGMSLLTQNQIAIVSVTLVTLILFVLYVYIKNIDSFKFNLDILKWIKYDSVELFNNLAFFLTYLFGLSNALEYGEAYASALTFVSLITDTQWDTIDAIVVAAKIDISKNSFNYKTSRSNGYKLLGVLLISSLIMFVVLYGFYELSFVLVIIYLSIEVVNFVLYPIYKIETCYLQLEYSAFKTTTNKIISSIIRFFMSFLKTPFCTLIGQLCSSVYQFVTMKFMFRRNFDVDNNGNVVKKG